MLLAICGKSGTGKSAIVKELINRGYKKIVTDTTRPMRKGEVNEVDYYFDTDEEFDELLAEGEFIENTSYKVATGDIWRYGTTKSAIAEADGKAVIILNPDGLKAFRAKEIPMKVVLINSNETLILLRLQKRGDNKSEILRRMEKDEKDFLGLHDLIDYEIQNDKHASIAGMAKMIDEYYTEELENGLSS